VREISMGQYTLTIEAATLTELKAQLRHHLSELEGELPVQTQLRFVEDEPTVPVTEAPKAEKPEEKREEKRKEKRKPGPKSTRDFENPTCRTCGVALNDTNWNPSLRPGYLTKNGKKGTVDLQCRTCRSAYMKTRREAKKAKPAKKAAKAATRRKREIKLPKKKPVRGKTAAKKTPAKETSKPQPSWAGFKTHLTETYASTMMDMSGVVTAYELMKNYYGGLRAEKWEEWSTGPSGTAVLQRVGEVLKEQEIKAPTVFMSQSVNNAIVLILMDPQKRSVSCLLSTEELRELLKTEPEGY